MELEKNVQQFNLPYFGMTDKVRDESSHNTHTNTHITACITSIHCFGFHETHERPSPHHVHACLPYSSMLNHTHYNYVRHQSAKELYT